MIKDFLYQKCTITNKSVSISWWEETPTITTIYTNIPCMIYSWNVTYKNTPLSKQTSATDMRCIIEWTKTLIRDKMDISITDDATWLVGEYTISWVRPLRLKWWKINHIEFDLNDKFLTR
jgi:hypothetical protein